MVLREEQQHFCSILAKNAKPEYNQEKKDKCKMQDTLENKWPVLIKKCKDHT